jgi:hypothetical protein
MTAPKDFEAYEEQSEEEKREELAGDQDVRPSGERIRELAEQQREKREEEERKK